MQVAGKIHEVSATQQVTEILRKREVILEIAENPQYPEYVKFEAVNDRCDLLNNVSVGRTAEVHFNLKGRPWTDKSGKKTYFNSLQLWKIEVSGNNTPVDNGEDLPF